MSYNAIVQRAHGYSNVVANFLPVRLSSLAARGEKYEEKNVPRPSINFSVVHLANSAAIIPPYRENIIRYGVIYNPARQPTVTVIDHDSSSDKGKIYQ